MFVTCKLCGERFGRMTTNHLQGRHGINFTQYVERFGNPNVKKEEVKKPKVKREILVQLWESIQENKMHLSSCEGPHDFVEIEDMPFIYKCLKCGGEARLDSVLWYRKGLHDGKKCKDSSPSPGSSLIIPLCKPKEERHEPNDSEPIYE